MVPKTNENKWSDKRYTINIALPQVLREEALTAYHDSGSGGAHPATKRVYEALRLKYWWPKMHQQVDDYIRSCDRCQRIKTRNQNHKAPLTPMPIADSFERWHRYSRINTNKGRIQVRFVGG